MYDYIIPINTAPEYLEDCPFEFFAVDESKHKTVWWYVPCIDMFDSFPGEMMQ